MQSCIHTFSPPRHGGGSGETHHRLFSSRSQPSAGVSPPPCEGLAAELGWLAARRVQTIGHSVASWLEHSRGAAEMAAEASGQSPHHAGPGASA
eukprot:COSAG01_NODE_63019_length_281_cov_6.252747_1_plen_93_part_11